jgi:hypothetical protein
LKEEVGAALIDGQISQHIELCEASHNSIYVESSLMLRSLCETG